MTIPIDEALINSIKNIARQAGDVILEIYDQEERGIKHKEDKTPVTYADLRANELIIRELNHLSPTLPILSEESAHQPLHERKQWQRYWLVDPLDGTQEFINRNGQFTVNIALMEGQYPLFGVVYVPVSDTCYWGGKNLSCYRQTEDASAEAITSRTIAVDKKVTALGSRSFGNAASDALIKKLHDYFGSIELCRIGSSLKGCRIAEGAADVYPRLGPTSEWDTAAVQAVVEGAGGAMLDPQGNRFKYNYKESLKNEHFLILGDLQMDWRRFWNRQDLSDAEGYTPQKT